MILLLTLSGLGMQSYLKANAQAQMSTRESQSRQAVYAAEGGIEWAKAQLNVNPYSTGQTISVAGYPVNVSIESTNEGYWVASLVSVGHARREIKVYLSLESGRWISKNYHEIHR